MAAMPASDKILAGLDAATLDQDAGVVGRLDALDAFLGGQLQDVRFQIKQILDGQRRSGRARPADNRAGDNCAGRRVADGMTARGIDLQHDIGRRQAATLQMAS
jgi:hypothetical protein